MDSDIVAYTCEGDIYCLDHAKEMDITDNESVAGPVYGAGSYAPVTYWDETQSCGYRDPESGRCGELLEVALSPTGYANLLEKVAEHLKTIGKTGHRPNPDLSEAWEMYCDNIRHMI